ncbi:hypothetical protein HK101_006969, partial [Irineochytrium annulatum]
MASEGVVKGLQVHTGWIEEHAGEVLRAAAGVKHIAFKSHGREVVVKGKKDWTRDVPAGSVPVVTPLVGTVVSVSVKLGDAVSQGQEVAVILAMKMEHVIKSPQTGRVHSMRIKAGDLVQSDDPLLFLTPLSSDDVTSRDASPTTTFMSSSNGALRPEIVALNSRLHLLSDSARAPIHAQRAKSGRRSARANVSDLCSRFLEYGALTIPAQRLRHSVDTLRANHPADGLICGVGVVDLPRDAGPLSCAVLAYDFTVLAGTQGYWSHRKMDRLLDVARRSCLPVVAFCEGGGGRPGDLDAAGVTVGGLDIGSFAGFAGMGSKAPIVCIAAGYVFAGNAALLACGDVIVGVQGAS